MSKAVTNEEVEDVLSSIRRLVSEDKRPLAGLSSAPQAPRTQRVAEEPVPDRLVLTPSLRVAATPAVAAEEDPLDLGSVARKTWAPSDASAAAEQNSGVRDDTAPEKEPTGSIDTLVHDTLVTQDLAEDESGLTDGDYSDEGYWDDNADDDVDPEDETVAKAVPSGKRPPLRQTAVEYGDATPELTNVQDTYGDDSDWDDEAAPDAELWDVEPAFDEDFRAAEAAYFQQEPTRDFEPADVAEEPAAVEPETPDASVLKADVPLLAKIAALGAAIGKSPDEWEPDGDDATALSARETGAMAWEDDVELDAKGAPLRTAALDDITDAEDDIADAEEATQDASEKDPVAAALGGDDQLMDEEALRDLVAEIVRAELQGALGERITRNVRKLVRREIHRALTAQELD